MILTTEQQQSTATEPPKEVGGHNIRINIPVDLENWKALPEDYQNDLAWFHQFVLEKSMSMKESADALNYDKTTIWRVLKGSYEGNWGKIVEAIRSYRKVALDRGDIQKNTFVANTISKLIFGGLSYALANNSITLITGDSRRGKTTSALAWRDANNHGRSVFVTAPAYGGTKRLLLDIATAVGHGKDHKNSFQLHTSILKAFNGNRILIVDEAHRLLPSKGCPPVNIEVLRDLHDRTGCALALLATARFDSELRKSEYMFEQLLGRIGLPIRLPRAVIEADIQPILQQYLKRPSAKVTQAALQIANTLGSIGVLVETLKVGSRIATKAKRPMCEEDFFKSLAIRKEMMGETQYAKKD